MATIYLPSEYVDNCNMVFNDYIRSYSKDFTTYTDIYFKNDYMLKFGIVKPEDHESIICDTANSYTSDRFYSPDFTNTVLLSFLTFMVVFMSIRRMRFI